MSFCGTAFAIVQNCGGSRMKATIAGCITVVALLAVPGSALAQRTPSAESGAVGGDVGLFLPFDDALGSGLALEGFYEYYFTARTSLRLGLGWANPSFDREDEDSLRHFRVAMDVVRNWEGGTIHPFVGGGAGIYFLQPNDNGVSAGDSETKFGATIFGGVEYFTSNTWSIKGEVRFHLISDAFGLNPDGVALTIGVKRYF
jgi:hypothetical protein